MIEEKEIGTYAEYGDHFDGDMILDYDQLAALFDETSVLNTKKYIWPNATVPDTDLNNEIVLAAMKIIDTICEEAFLFLSFLNEKILLFFFSFDRLKLYRLDFK